MAETGSTLMSVAVQLRSLSSDKENQPIIARDEGCMSALSNFLVTSDMAVCEVAVTALGHLSSHSDNREILRGEFDIWENLHKLVENQNVPLSHRREAFKIMKHIADGEEDELEELRTLERHGSEIHYKMTREPMTWRLHVPGLSSADFLDDFEHRLIRSKGVLAVSYEMGAEVAVIFARVAPEDLLRLVQHLSAKEVELLPEAEEEEEETNGQESWTNGATDENKQSNDGGYVDEERARYRKYAQKAKRTAVTNQASTLAQRLEAERRGGQRDKARSDRMLDRLGKSWKLW